QLLVYKIIANLFISVTTAVFMIIWLRHRAGSVWGGLVALVLIMNFIHLFSMATALITGAAGAEAYRHRRRLMLAGLIVLASLFVWHARRSGVSGGLLQWLSALEQIPVVHRLLTPLRWFIAAFTAERIWSDFVKWASLSAAVNGVLLAIVLGLDAQYLEA